MMRSWRATAAVLVLGTVATAAAAQTSPAAPEAAVHDRLVLWLVHPSARSALQKALDSQSNAVPNTLGESTVSSFGQTAGSYGQTAGSYGHPTSDDKRNVTDNNPTAGDYGQTAASFGQPSSTVGQTAGSYGQTAGSLGQTSGAAGQTAGSYGQTAGSFGEGLSTIAAAGGKAQRAAERAFHHPPHGAEWDAWLAGVRSAFPELKVDLVDVRDDELGADLGAAANTAQAPDVLLGNPLPPSWRPGTGGTRTFVAASLGVKAKVRQADLSPDQTTVKSWEPEASLLVRAPHPAQARAFMVWLLSGGNCAGCNAPATAQASGSPGDVAQRALGGLLGGEALDGIADPQMARFSPGAVRAEALGATPVSERLNTRIDVTAAQANDHLAVVTMRATLWSASAMGVLDALAVLRRDGSGRWRVLQVTPNLQHDALAQAASSLEPFCKPGRPARVAGVNLAAPADGDSTGPQPELWWDNGGGAGLEVVEWQVRAGTGALDSHLYFLPDTNSRLRTRATAPFAAAGAYRWRVWSVGQGGVSVLSPWRSLTVNP